ncbi:hypothetical protein EHV15_17600 [Paenibacillus oralis]|uniref:Uncharacterized protein n=1 Tax=Paenibacillus oralis TaxID=2490856 RepID=A0A3P3U4N6_9BACL|nr:hypothetical protein [Paenibacillus oralis]RRJ64538.1 hypothetical protein EHV15_17600 [Paenibacillus oralis]
MKKGILSVLLLLLSALLGFGSFFLVVNVIFSSSNTLVSGRNTTVFFKNLLFLVMILVGYGLLLMWVKKKRSFLIILLNVALFFTLLFSAAPLSLKISSLQMDDVPAPNLEERLRIYDEVKEKIIVSKLPYELNVVESEEYNKADKYKISIVLINKRAQLEFKAQMFGLIRV